MAVQLLENNTKGFLKHTYTTHTYITHIHTQTHTHSLIKSLIKCVILTKFCKSIIIPT